jgi:hypothetical protein
VAATKIKVIELAKELGVTSKDIMLAAEEMGRKGVRAMTPLDTVLAHDLRVKLGKGREIPEEAKPKRPRAKPVTAEAAEGEVLGKTARVRKAKTEALTEEPPLELKPAATIVKPKPAEPPVEVPEPIKPVAEVIYEPRPVAAPTPVEPMPPAPARPPVTTPSPGPAVKRPEPKIVPFRPLERPAPTPWRLYTSPSPRDTR